jgi:hypothetical protein
MGQDNMKSNGNNQLVLENFEDGPNTYGAVILNKEKFIEALTEINQIDNLYAIKNKIIALKNILTNYSRDKEGILNIDANGDTISLRKDVLTSELNQILESQTVEYLELCTKINEKKLLEVKCLS